MAEGSDATETKEVTTPLAPDTTQPEVDPKEGQDQADPKGDLNIALSRERAEKQALKTRIEELEAKERAKELDSLPEGERLDEEYRLLTTERVINSVGIDKLAGLPSSVRRMVEEDPWSIVPQRELDLATVGATTKREFYNKAATVAIEALQALIKESTPQQQSEKTEEEKADPSTEAGTKAPDNLSSFTESQLLVMSQADPERFARLVKSAKGK